MVNEMNKVVNGMCLLDSHSIFICDYIIRNYQSSKKVEKYYY